MPATRAAQGPSKPPLPTSSNSSSSLSSRATRANGNKNGSPPVNGDTPRSHSSEESQPPARRSQRAQTKANEEPIKHTAEVEEGAVDEEEVTRCICSQQDYPGPPLSEAFVGADAQSEDAGGLFIQCDGCSVWQHGGCVGIVEESQSPDKYYCEECRPKQHEVHTDPRGQRYSLYLPLHSRSHRKGSISKPDEKAKRDRENAITRASVDSVPGRRRPTMRSRENYEEEEQFRQAIEESKRDTDSGTGGRRNGKRAREDGGEEPKQGIKRQRTASESMPSHMSIAHTASIEDDSGDEGGGISASRAKKAKSEATESARQAEMREREKERERVRAEQAGRRQARAGRRRGDESEPIEDTPKPTSSAKQSPPPPSSQPPTPPSFAPPPPEKVSHKKGAGKKTKKLGNNQYTKQRELAALNQAAAPSPYNRKRQLNHTHADSGDEQLANNADTGTSNSTSKNSPGHNEGSGNNNGCNNSNNPTTGPGTVKGKFGRGKNRAGGVNGYTNAKNAAAAEQQQPEKNLANMTRAVDSMAAFIAKAQAESSFAPAAVATSLALRGLLVEDAGVGGVGIGDGRDWGAPDELGLLRPPMDGAGGGGSLTAAEMAQVLGRNLMGFREKFGPSQQVAS